MTRAWGRPSFPSSRTASAGPGTRRATQPSQTVKQNRNHSKLNLKKNLIFFVEAYVFWKLLFNLISRIIVFIVVVLDDVFLKLIVILIFKFVIVIVIVFLII